MVEIINDNNIFNKEISKKEEFLSIKQRYVGCPMTQQTLQNMHTDFLFFFKKWDLEDFHYNIIKTSDHSLQFNPIREIDRLALIGILYEDL